MFRSTHGVKRRPALLESNLLRDNPVGLIDPMAEQRIESNAGVAVHPRQCQS